MTVDCNSIVIVHFELGTPLILVSLPPLSVLHRGIHYQHVPTVDDTLNYLYIIHTISIHDDGGSCRPSLKLSLTAFAIAVAKQTGIAFPIWSDCTP